MPEKINPSDIEPFTFQVYGYKVIKINGNLFGLTITALREKYPDNIHLYMLKIYSKLCGYMAKEKIIEPETAVFPIYEILY